MWFVVPLLLLFVGCEPPPYGRVPDDYQSFALDTTEEQWLTRLGTWSQTCDDYRKTLKISLIYANEYFETCPRNTYACTVFHLSTPFAGKTEPYLVLNASFLSTSEGTMVVHEYVHVLSSCVLGNSDGSHANPNVWMQRDKDGNLVDLDSVERRAKYWLLDNGYVPRPEEFGRPVVESVCTLPQGQC